jgi:uncharacterized membrane protein
VTPPRWVPRATTALCLVGLAAAAYLTYAHYSSPSALVCSDTGIVNCARVTTSKWSTISSVPVAVLGLGYFVVLTPLCLPVAWRSSRRWVHAARLGSTIVGVLMVLWLVYVEFGLIGKVCLWCSVVHLMTLAVFAIVMLYGVEPAARHAVR